MNFMSLFSGGGLADVGAKAAGFNIVAANEIDQDIAEVYKDNLGDHIRVGDVCDENPRHYPDVDLFHASPVCTNASIANANGEESKIDIATAKKTAQFIRVKKPRFVTIENVSGYRAFASFKIIMSALDDLGYFYDVSIFNSADFGVAQTRRRLIVRAVRNGFVPPLPQAVKWVGWYEAVQDLIDKFPETRFAPWQIEKLSETIPHTSFITRPKKQNPDTERGRGFYFSDEPTPTIMTKNEYLRAFVVSGGQAQNYKQRSADGSTTKAVIRKSDEPMFTIVAGMPRQPARAWLDHGRVVRITPRGLARFQSVPDDYRLPQSESLSCKIIGNGVPPMMYRAIAKSFMDFYSWPRSTLHASRPISRSAFSAALPGAECSRARLRMWTA